MPQPLLDNVIIDISEGLPARPELAALVGQISGSWAVVEFGMEQLLGRVLRAESAAGVTPRPKHMLYKRTDFEGIVKRLGDLHEILRELLNSFDWRAPQQSA
jgi:hypothetical protein